MSAVPVKQLVARFEVPYAAGELKAIGIIDGKDVITQSITTTGTPAKIILVPERLKINADRNDLAYVDVLVADIKGNLVPNASLPVTFEINGDGELAGAGNSSPDQMASFHQLKCNTFRGRALIILRPFDKKGKITLNVRSEGLNSASAEITVK
jgi:beta-galactosidase